MRTTRIVQGALALAIAQCMASAGYAQDRALAAPADSPAADQGTSNQLPKIDVRARHSREDTWPKLQHIMREVDGPLITVTKKTSITKVDNIPTVIDNNLRDLFAQTPGLFYSEQQTPGQLNLSLSRHRQSAGIGIRHRDAGRHSARRRLDRLPDHLHVPAAADAGRSAADPRRQLAAVRTGAAAGGEPDQPQAGGRPRIGRLHRERRRQQRPVRYVQPGRPAPRACGITSSTRTTAQTDGQRDNGDSTLRGLDLHVGYRPDESAYTRPRFPSLRSQHRRSGQARATRSSSPTRTSRRRRTTGCGPIATCSA